MTGLRVASNLRCVLTKKNRGAKIVDVKKNGDEMKQRGRKTNSGRGFSSRTKNDQIVDETKKMKAEWGRAFKHMNEGKEPVFDIFFQISKTGECCSDPFYQKIFREMSYGTFPKGIFYDKNRDCLVCTEGTVRMNSTMRQGKVEKFIRVCIPERISKSLITTTHTNERTRDTDIEEHDADQTDNVELKELMERRAVKFIYRCNQRLELPVEILNTKYGLSLERVYQEIKLFMYMTLDLLSPWDANIIQEDNYQSIQSKERITALKPQRSWRKLSHIEQISFLCQFCKSWMFQLVGKPLDKLTPHQEKILDQTKEYLCGLLILGFIPPGAVEFDSSIRRIHGLEITLSGVKLNKEVMEGFREERGGTDEDPKIVPVTIQKYKTVDLQKISNGVQKQTAKTSKMIKVLTETDIDTTMDS